MRLAGGKNLRVKLKLKIGLRILPHHNFINSQKVSKGIRI